MCLDETKLKVEDYRVYIYVYTNNLSTRHQILTDRQNLIIEMMNQQQKQQQKFHCIDKHF